MMTMHAEDTHLVTKNPFMTPVVVLLLGPAYSAFSVFLYCIGWLMPAPKRPELRALPSRSRPARVQVSDPPHATEEKMKDDGQHASFAAGRALRRLGLPTKLPTKVHFPTPHFPTPHFPDRSVFSPRSSTDSDTSTLVSVPSPKPSRANSTGSIPKVDRRGSIASFAHSAASSLVHGPSLPVRLPSVKLLKTKSRRTPGVDRQRAGSDPCTYTTTPLVEEPEEMLASPTRRSSLPQPQRSRTHGERPPNSTAEVVYRTTFVNPFRIKPRRTQTMHDLPSSKVSSKDYSTDSDHPARPQQRRSLNSYLHINISIPSSLLSSRGHPSTPPASPASNSAQAVPRTQGTPHFARMPTEANISRRLPTDANVPFRPRRTASYSPAAYKERRLTMPEASIARVHVKERQRPRSEVFLGSKTEKALGVSLGEAPLGEEVKRRRAPHRHSVSESATIQE